MADRAHAPAAGGPEDAPPGPAFPDVSELAGFRAASEGVDSRVAVERFVPHLLGEGTSARALIGRIRWALQHVAAGGP